ncbi:antibiotic biosynthesis monooxygenase [Paenibacillus sp. TCA20]|uniref:antibiotic biosynthesis monooxygenase family protein n=1 Tax=Paenibacillus sp. TCA20 TaxID=1499968 RepID=UPI0004D5A874|nr:antibiotic biosynthesis monooxygenase [Paenibacillus sp. TCA20]GAK38900.1 antibiotic biosynthesis monooxygenase [Paenibacillus sp. TCA20]
MILESAMLYIRAGLESDFEQDFAKASAIISSMSGYLGHELYKCMESDHQYLLHVRWNSLEDHTIGFRGSAEYLEWKQLLHHYYEPFPVVEHFQRVNLNQV